MNKEQGRAETESKEFRVRYSIWMHGLFIVEFLVCIVLLFVPIKDLVDMRREMSAGASLALPSDLWPELVLMMLGWSLFFLLWAVVTGYFLISYWLEQKRGRVVVDEQNLSLTDWRGRERTIPLSDIQELRKAYWVASKSSHLSIKVRGKWISLSQGLEKKDEAAEIIIARGRLQQRWEKRFATSYTREG